MEAACVGAAIGAGRSPAGAGAVVGVSAFAAFATGGARDALGVLTGADFSVAVFAGDTLPGCCADGFASTTCLTVAFPDSAERS